MTGGKIFKKLLSGIVLSLALSGLASADLIEATDFLNLNSYTTPTGAFTITPFDTTLGTLNSVTMRVDLSVNGTGQLWTSAQDTTLAYSASNTLSAVQELGWGATVASTSGSAYLFNSLFGWFEWPYEAYLPFTAPLGSNSAGDTMITAGFGRFIGASPFDIGLSLLGSASSTWSVNPGVDENGAPTYDTLIFGYDGTAQLYYAYDYTPAAPVPIPAAAWLLGTGLLGLVGVRRRMRT